MLSSQVVRANPASPSDAGLGVLKFMMSLLKETESVAQQSGRINGRATQAYG
jgi:hypothetical protein